MLRCVVLFSLAAFCLPAMGDNGEQLFQRHCAACHGSRGEGGVGVPLSLPSFIDSVDDGYLITTIKLGRPGRVMPSFSHLPQGDVLALVKYMRNWTGRASPALKEKVAGGDIKKGEALYAKHCVACHGAHGEGGKGTGVTFSRPRELPILAPALNNSGFLAAASDQLIKQTLTTGRKGTPMANFASSRNLSDSDINDLVAYVRSFENGTVATSVLPDDSKESAIIVRESPYSVRQTVENVKNAVLGANMRLIRVQNLEQGFVDKDKENPKQVIIYSCGFNFLYEAMKVDPRVGLFLPCKVSVVETQGKVLVMTINPKKLARFFNNAELNRLCDQMYQRYNDMLDEATL